MSTLDEARAKCIELINQAKVSNGEEKKNILSEVQELAVHRYPELLSEVAASIVEFQTDQIAGVKQFVADFVKQAGKQEKAMVPTFVSTLAYLVCDSSTAVVKRVFLALCDLFRIALMHVSNEGEEASAVWDALTAVKATAMQNLDATNDGLRTHAVKLCGCIALAFSMPAEGKVDKTHATVANVRSNHPILKVQELQTEGEQLVSMLSERLQKRSKFGISAVVLPVLVGELCSIAKQRPQFVPKCTGAVVAAAASAVSAMQAESTGWEGQRLSKSQTNSMADACKRALLGLIKLHGTSKWHNEIAQRLQQFGAKKEAEELMRQIAKKERAIKRHAEAATAQSSSKRVRSTAPIKEEEGGAKKRPAEGSLKVLKTGSSMNDPRKRQAPQSSVSARGGGEGGRGGPSAAWPRELQDFMEDHRCAEAWTPQKVADRVLKNFQTFKPAVQKDLPKITQEIAEALGTFVKIYQKLEAVVKSAAPPAPPSPAVSPEEERLPEELQDQPQSKEEHPETELELVAAAPRLSDSEPAVDAMVRVLQSDNWLAKILPVAAGPEAGEAAMMLRSILLTRMAGIMQEDGEAQKGFMAHILHDKVQRLQLAVHWLHQVYYEKLRSAKLVSHSQTRRHDAECYTRLFMSMLEQFLPSAVTEAEVVEQPDTYELESETDLTMALLCSAPSLPCRELGELLRDMCLRGSGPSLAVGLQILQELCLMRPPCRESLLPIILQLAVHSEKTVQFGAIERIRNALHSSEVLMEQVETFATQQLDSLVSLVKLEGTEGDEDGSAMLRLQLETQRRLLLYCHLCVRRPELLKALATTYNTVPKYVQDEIDAQLPKIAKSIGSANVPLQGLIRDFPLFFAADKIPLRFVLRIVNALTEHLGKPSESEVAEANSAAELPTSFIEAVLQLHSETDEAGLVVHVLPGLAKEDVLHYLPRVVEMENKDGVCHAFLRLLQVPEPPLTPAELLNRLHQMDPDDLNVDPKQKLSRVITATTVCFSTELRKIFQKEVFAVVIQQLLDVTPLPKLFMRTVLQALVNFPSLVNFVVDILASLVSKAIWEDKGMWRGFVKTAENAGAAALPVMLQLPPPQLIDALSSSDVLKTILVDHVGSAAPGSVPSAIVQAVHSLNEQVAPHAS